jgi:putative flippase GtrA
LAGKEALTSLAPVGRTFVTATLLRRRSAAAQAVDGPVPGKPTSGAAENGLSDWLRGEGTLAQFARFVLVGGSTTVGYALLFLLMAHLWGINYMAAHVTAIVASTGLANELHRRLTFHAEDRVGWFTAQWEAGGISMIGLFATSTALGWLDVATASAHHALQIAVVVAITALIGLIRFVALRWIFRSRPS